MAMGAKRTAVENNFVSLQNGDVDNDMHGGAHPPGGVGPTEDR